MKKENIYLMTVKEMEKAGIHCYDHNRGGNEASQEKHIRSIIIAFQKYGGYGHFPAIMVDEKTKTILDGNTRFLAAKRLSDVPDGAKDHIGNTYFGKMDVQVRVHFINLGEDENVDDFVRLFNNTQKKWMTMDYIANAKSRGFDAYKKLDEFCNTNGFVKGESITYSYALPLFGIKRSAVRDPDKFKFDDKTYQFAQVLAEEIKKMDDMAKDDFEINISTQGGWVEARNKAWYEYRKSKSEFDFQWFLKALNKELETKGFDSALIKSCKQEKWEDFFNRIDSIMLVIKDKETEAMANAL